MALVVHLDFMHRALLYAFTSAQCSKLNIARASDAFRSICRVLTHYKYESFVRVY